MKQQVQKQNHDKHSKCRELQIGDHVYVKNRSSGDRWLAGTVTTVSGPVSYNVRLSVFGNVNRINSENVTLTLPKVLWWMYLLVTHHLQ